MAYQKKVWKDLPSEETPLDEIGFNDWEDRIASAIDPVIEKTKQINNDGNIKISATPNLPSDVTASGTIRAHKDTVMNIVNLFGRIQTSGAVSANKVLANLPVGFRPSYSQYFSCDNNINSLIRVFVEANTGDIRTSSSVSQSATISLSGIVVDLSS